MRNLLVIAAIVAGAFLVISFGKKVTAPDPPAGGHSGSVQIALSTIQTYRTITVSPTSVTCGSYHRGQAPNKSSGALGFPNGTCAVGDRVKQKDPVTITYNGMPGDVYVHAGWALPTDNGAGAPWHPCSSRGHLAVRCTGTNGLPGYNQYTVRNFSPQTQVPTQLTGNSFCDIHFRPSIGCYATRGNSQREGFYITGPSKLPGSDTAQAWSAWVIWMAVPPGPHAHND